MWLLFQSLPLSCLRLQRSPRLSQNLPFGEGEHFTVNIQLRQQHKSFLFTFKSRRVCTSETVRTAGQLLMKYHVNCYSQTSRFAEESWILVLLSPHAPPAALNMEAIQYSKCKQSFTGTLLPCSLFTILFSPWVCVSVCVCIFKYMRISAVHLMWHPPIIPSHWLLCRLIPQTCHTSPPSTLPARQRRGTTVRETGILKPPRRQPLLWIPKHASSAPFQSSLGWPSPPATPSPAPPNNLLVHSPCLTSVYTSASSCLALPSPFSCRAWQAKSGGKRLMMEEEKWRCAQRDPSFNNSCIFLTHLEPSANGRYLQICPSCLVTWASRFIPPC